MSNISDWSNTAGANNDPPPDGAPEGMAANSFNDTMREMMAAVSRWFDDVQGTSISAGNGNNYTLTTNNNNATFADIGMVTFRADRTNGGASTLDVDGTGANPIKIGGNDLEAGDITADQVYLLLPNINDNTYEYINERPIPSTASVPTGASIDFCGTVAPSGFLLCDGSAVGRTAEADLFAAIGTTWGIGDGSTTFNLPNFNRTATVGSGGSGSAELGNTVGSTGGEETHVLVEAEISENNSNDWSTLDDVGNGLVNGSSVANHANKVAAGHNNLQPSAVVLKIIKT